MDDAVTGDVQLTEGLLTSLCDVPALIDKIEIPASQTHSLQTLKAPHHLLQLPHLQTIPDTNLLTQSIEFPYVQVLIGLFTIFNHGIY